MSTHTNRLDVLKSLPAILASMVLGAVIGIGAPTIAEFLQPMMTIFLSLMRMCALPIVVAAVLLSFARLWRQRNALRSLSLLGAIFAVGVTFASLMGLAAGLLASRVILADPGLKRGLGALLDASGSTFEATSTESVWAFLLRVIPSNIFHSLANGEVLGVLVFVIVLGSAIGLNRHRSGAVVLLAFDEFNEALFRVVDWVTYLLPFAMCALVANTFAKVGGDGFAIFGKLIGIALAGLCFLTLLHAIIMSAALRVSIGEIYQRLRPAGMVALTSSSSLASMPPLTTGLTDRGLLPAWVPNLVLPIAITFNQHASAFTYCMFAGFSLRLYELPVTAATAFPLMAACYLHALVGAGMPSTASTQFIAAIYSPFGIPGNTLATIVLNVDPILDPIATVTNSTGYAAATAVFGSTQRQQFESDQNS